MIYSFICIFDELKQSSALFPQQSIFIIIPKWNAVFLFNHLEDVKKLKTYRKHLRKWDVQTLLILRFINKMQY